MSVTESNLVFTTLPSRSRKYSISPGFCLTGISSPVALPTPTVYIFTPDSFTFRAREIPLRWRSSPSVIRIRIFSLSSCTKETEASFIADAIFVPPTGIIEVSIISSVWLKAS